MNYLLDTCFVSELYKARPNPGVVEWLAGIEEGRLFISLLSLNEIQKGITRLDDGKRRRDIQTWLDQDVRQRFDGRALGVDLEIALEWGRLCGDSERRGSPVPVIDGLLAATAICRSLVLVSRNEADFSRFPIRLLNPWNGADH